MEKYYLEDVFTTTGVPTVTYVQPKEYTELLIAIRTKGKCVVVEGPSGIGKTTAVEKVIISLYGAAKIPKATPHNSQSKNRTLCIAANCR